tara:strand:+ start:4745 stop:5275 length:531 start_codon:yes stop_codon:yes gene_type:complete
MRVGFNLLFIRFLAAIGLVTAPLIANANVGDVDLKAVYLFRFALLADWQESGIATDHIDYCVAQTSDVAIRLEAIVAAKPKTARFHKLFDDVHPEVCHILFVEHGDAAFIADLHVQYPHALLVGNGVDFVASGGMIAFIKVRNRIRPLVSRKNVEKTNILLRSQLLEVSEIYEETT